MTPLATSRTTPLGMLLWVILAGVLCLNFPAQLSAEELLIVTEMKEVSEDFGYMIDVTVVNNRYTGKRDLRISPSEGYNYETEIFIRNVCAAVATVTAQSPIYKTYIDMVMFDINGELWAISTASCRKTFSMTTEYGRETVFKNRLQRLR